MVTQTTPTIPQGPRQGRIRASMLPSAAKPNDTVERSVGTRRLSSETSALTVPTDHREHRAKDARVTSTSRSKDRRTRPLRSPPWGARWRRCSALVAAS